MRASIATVLLFLAGCASSAPYDTPACTSDAQCGAGLVCFAEGCGDPGKGLVVEVTGSGSSYQFVKDVPIPDGALAPTYDVALGDPLLIIGEFQRELTAKVDPANRTAYLDDVRLQATGVSDAIPGISRSFEQRIVAPVRGTYQLGAGAGTYTVIATPLDTSVPPLWAQAVVVRDGQASPVVDFAFPAVDGAITLSGRLLKTIDSSKVPAVEYALTEAGTAMDLQAFDPETNLPLSQRFPVSSGQAGATGNFTITMSPVANTLKAILLVATPRVAGSPVPSENFTVMAPFPDTVTLQLGDPGSWNKVVGVAVTSSGAFIPNAQVIIVGTTAGGGTFRSKIALTDSAGVFSLDTLPGAMQLTIVPPAGTLGGTTTINLNLSSVVPASLVVTCPDRIALSGTVVQPDGTPAVGVGVRAIEHLASTADAQPLALDNVDGVTDTDGNFSLYVDPADWRLEFYPGDRYPLASRLVTVATSVDVLGRPVKTQALFAPVQLAAGRTVKGTVTGTIGSQPGSTIAYATLRFFRVAPVGGVPVATLIGSAVADKIGQYSLVWPDTKQ